MVNKVLITLIISMVLYFGHVFIYPAKNKITFSNKTNVETNQTTLTKSFKQNPIKIQSIEAEDKSDLTTPENKPMTLNPELEENFDLDRFDPLLDELKYGRFSNDPIEELFSITRELQGCKRSKSYLNVMNQNETWYQIVKQQLDKQCKTLAIKYPRISEIKSDKEVKSLLVLGGLNSIFADLFKRLLMKEEGDQIDHDIVSIFLKSNNALLIQVLSDMPSRNKLILITDQVAAQLKTTNESYIQLITKQAIEVYACRYNEAVTCNSYSMFMLRKCRTQEQLCGKNTMFWFNEYISEGHRRDINLVMEILLYIGEM